MKISILGLLLIIDAKPFWQFWWHIFPRKAANECLWWIQKMLIQLYYMVTKYWNNVWKCIHQRIILYLASKKLTNTFFEKRPIQLFRKPALLSDKMSKDFVATLGLFSRKGGNTSTFPRWLCLTLIYSLVLHIMVYYGTPLFSVSNH